MASRIHEYIDKRSRDSSNSTGTVSDQHHTIARFVVFSAKQ